MEDRLTPLKSILDQEGDHGDRQEKSADQKGDNGDRDEENHLHWTRRLGRMLSELP